jgi:hypothetical protein
VGLGIVALILFGIIHARREREKDAAVIRAIEKESEEFVDPTDRDRVVADIVGEEIERQRQEEAAKAEAERKAAERRKKRVRYETRPLGHLESTPPELRERIDRLVDTAVNLSLTVEADEAREDLIEIRKPAIPRILNRFVGLDMTDMDHIQMANILHQTLREMTGYDKITFSPMNAEDDLQKRFREAAIRFWFQWWGENEETFE